MNRTIGCFAVIEDKDHKILVVKRNDVPLWDLPGGRKDKGETLEECVIREVKEETGLEIEIDYLIGEFQRPKANDIQYVYACRRVYGDVIERGEETKKLKYISPFLLPIWMVPNRKKQIMCYRRGNIDVRQILKDHHVFFVLQKLMKSKWCGTTR